MAVQAVASVKGLVAPACRALRMALALGSLFGLACIMSVLGAYIEQRRPAPAHPHDHTGRRMWRIRLYSVFAILFGLLTVELLINCGENALRILLSIH
jgi:hypothetical protein